MKKRAIVVLSSVLLAAPLLAALATPQFRQRAHERWTVHQLRTADRTVKLRLLERLLSRTDSLSDELFSEVMAAAITTIESRSVLVVDRAGEISIPLKDAYSTLSYPGYPNLGELRAARALTSAPNELWITKPSRDEPLYRETRARSLVVARSKEIVVWIPLEGARGERLLATVEERLRLEQ